MALAAFPSTVNQIVLQEQYSETLDTNITSFKPQVGAPQLRRRSELGQDLITCKMQFNSQEWNDFRAFYRTTLLDGTQQFTWVHPRTQAAATFQFEGDAPKVTGTFGITFEVQFVLRLISGGRIPPAILFDTERPILTDTNQEDILRVQ